MYLKGNEPSFDVLMLVILDFDLKTIFGAAKSVGDFQMRFSTDIFLPKESLQS